MTCQPAFSHGTQLVPLAWELMRRGHRVLVATSASFAPELGSYGLETATFGPNWTIRPGDPVFDRTVGGKAFFGFPEVADQSAVEGLSGLAATFEPDLIVREYSEFAGWAISRSRNVPLVTQGIIHRLSPPAEDRLVEQVERIAAMAGVEPPCHRDELLGAAHLDIVPPTFRCPWEHDSPLSCPSRPSLFDGLPGPVPAWLEQLGTERPALYVTLGTIFSYAPRAWRAVLAALADLDVDALVTTGGTHVPDLEYPTPPNVRVERYLPQSRVLPRCQAVVCHAGYNTLIGAFLHGLPVVCLPLDADQPVNAGRCAAAGAGINAANGPAIDARGPLVDPDTLDPERISGAISEILHKPDFAEAARHIGDEIRSMPGPDTVGGLVEHLAGGTRPAHPPTTGRDPLVGSG